MQSEIEPAPVTVAQIARTLNERNARRAAGPALPSLILMTDPNRLPDPLEAAQRLPRGAAVILRAYEEPEQARLAESLTDLARKHGLVVLIANDARLALAVGAQGAHFAEARIADAATARLRPDWLITCAAHSLPALERAAQMGVDAALLSPVFATASHPDRRPLGIHGFANLARRARLPVYALGGITERNASSLLVTEAVGIAAIGALASA